MATTIAAAAQKRTWYARLAFAAEHVSPETQFAVNLQMRFSTKKNRYIEPVLMLHDLTHDSYASWKVRSPNPVFTTDITDVSTKHGIVYLFIVMHWINRRLLP